MDITYVQISSDSFLKQKLCIWAEECLFSTAMTFVFSLLTVSFHFWQYACKLSKWLCRPVLVSDVRIRSSALSRSLTKVKYTLSILQIYWKYTSKVYLKYTSSILRAYFKYISSILEVYFNLWITEEEVYFKSMLFRQKKYIWSTFCEIKSVF